MTALRLDKFDATALESDPYTYMVVEDFVEASTLNAARAAYPDVPGAGSHPSTILKIEPDFQALIDALRGPDFQAAVARKFDVDLSDRPTMYTVRGFCRARDGKIHTDSKTKIITVLLYMNEDDWPSDGGRLRILRDGQDIENFATEVEPKGGTIIVFRRSDASWHGHHSYEGPRRAIQLNWVTDDSVVAKEQSRHGLSSKIKRIFGG